MESTLGSITGRFLFAAVLAIVTPGAWAGQSAFFQAINFPGCRTGPWKAFGKENTGASVVGIPLGFTDCRDGSGLLGIGTPDDPYRLALDGKHESVDVSGIDATTRAGYTVQVWFRVRSAKMDRMMLVDSRADRFYVPLRMMVANGTLQCSIEMPFPDRIYQATSSAPLAVSRWYQAACRFRAQSHELSVFLNGRMHGSTRVPPGSIRSTHIRIGGNPTADGENFAGDIGEVIFSAASDEPEAIQTRCKEESRRFAGAECQN